MNDIAVAVEDFGYRDVRNVNAVVSKGSISRGDFKRSNSPR